MKRKNKLLAAAGLLGTAGLGLTAEHFVKLALVPGKYDRDMTRGNVKVQADPTPAEVRIGENARAVLDQVEGRFKESPPEVVAITNREGLVLKADLAPGTGHDWAILLHGYQGRRQETRPFALRYGDWGFHCLMPDLRAHGESGGKYIGMGWADRLDILDWIDWILRRDPDARITLHGHSMGAAAALMTCGENPAGVVAAVADCPYTSAWDIFGWVLEFFYRLPTAPLLHAANTAFRLRGGYDLRAASALEAAGRSRVPTLFIHGTADSFVPFWMGKTIHDAAQCQKAWLEVPEATHAMSQFLDPELYWNTVREFLEQHK